MTTNISPRDWEALSAYLDGQLGPGERAHLERSLQESADYRQALEDLRRTRAVLRATPRLRAPRSFALKPEMVAAKGRSFPGFAWFPALRLTSALASMMLVVTLLGEFLVGRPAVMPVAEAPAVMAVSEDAAAESMPAPETALQAPVDAARNIAPTEATSDALPLAAAPMAAGAYPEPTADAALSAYAVEEPMTVEGGAELMTSTVGLAMQAPAGDPYPAVEAAAKLAPEANPVIASDHSQPAPVSPWSVWRVGELILGVVAALSGLLAFLVWRNSR